MRNFEVRNDGPPDFEWFGSFDNFRTEFSISQLVEEKFTPTNKRSMLLLTEHEDIGYYCLKCGERFKDGYVAVDHAQECE